MEHQIDATRVIARLSNQISSLHVELATKDSLVEQLETEITRLQELVDEKANELPATNVVGEVVDNGKQERKAATKG